VLFTKRQRNQIFERLASAGVDPQSCTLADPLSTWRSFYAVIRHEPSLSEFKIKADKPGTYVAFIRVGDTDQGRSPQVNWDALIASLDTWAQEVAYEIEKPDLWTELRQVPHILAGQSADASNEPFTAEEQAQITARIDQAKEAVRKENPELTVEQMSAIERTLDEVKEATTRVRRKDWVMLTNGALLSLVVNDAVPAHVVQSVFNMLITGIGHLFGVGGPPPMIST